MAVVTVSRQMGSLGTEIAQILAERLQYEYVDKDKIGKVLATYGLPALDLEKFDEKKPPFWDSWQIQRKKFLHFLEAVIYEFARKGNVVIVGRGGQVFLKDLPGVLHLRVIAPLALRVKRSLAENLGDEKQVARLLRRNDRDSEGFIRSFLDVNWDDSESLRSGDQHPKNLGPRSRGNDFAGCPIAGNPGGRKTGGEEVDRDGSGPESGGNPSGPYGG